MNPISLRLRGYRTFESLDLDLPVGCVGVLGLNGAGKSSVVNAIDLGLFGPEGRSWAPYLTVGAESTELMVEVTFAHAGELYRVRRGYSARGAGKSSLDLERLAIDQWEPLTLGSAKETQALLEQTLGFTRRTLRASSLLLQGDGAAFTEADPKDRKRILADTLGLDRFEQLLAAVRRDRRSAEKEVERIDGRLEGVTRDDLQHERTALANVVDEHTATIALAQTALTSWEGELEKAAAAVQAAKENETARVAMKTRVDAAAAALAAKGQLQRDAIAAEEQAAGVRTKLGELFGLIPVTAEAEQQERDLVTQIEAHRVAVAERNQLVSLRELRAAEAAAIDAQVTSVKAKRDQLDGKIAHLESGELDTCPTCEQQLGAEARAATVGSLRAQAQAAQDEAAALVERAAMIVLPEIPVEPVLPVEVPAQLNAVRSTLTAARDAELERAKLTERLAGFEKTIKAASEREYLDELTAAETTLNDLVAESEKLTVIDVAPLEAAAIQARGHVQVERDRLQTAERDKAVAQERLDQLTIRTEQLEKDLAARETHQAEIDLLAILERAYGPDGIPALIVENAAIPAIEVEANRILVALAGTTAGCRVELRTDRAKQDGGVRDDVLDVVVITEAGERAYETFSGGERTRLNLALRIALARLLATRRGAESRVLAIDEPEFLDEDGTAALVDVLRELEQTGVFDRVYLVSHVPALRDSFDVVLQVVKDPDGRSRVEGALTEAVAA